MPIATSFGVLNYSGALFNKGNTRTPLSAIIGSRARVTNSVEFVVGQSYQSGGGAQPNISENGSLTAPTPSVVTRTQYTNVTQIFQETVGVSYAKRSNMRTLSGANIAGARENPMSELDFQMGAVMDKVAADIEYTFINGVYNKATNDNEVNKTRGLVAAITDNVIDCGGKPLGIWDIAELIKLVYESNAPTRGLVLWCDATTMFQLNADAQHNGLSIVPASREINGISLSSVLTPIGEVNLMLGEYLPAGTALLLNLDVIAPVNQPVPGKGNFFLEELARTGAGETYQLFGQIGLDCGPSWYHGKFTNISTSFAAPEGSKVIIAAPVATVEVDATITGASINKTTVDPLDTNTVSVTDVTYNVLPGTAPTLAYLWQIRTKSGTTWSDLTDSYTGYNTSTLTIKAADAEKHYRCKVTASGTASGTVYTPECTVNAAGE